MRNETINYAWLIKPTWIIWPEALLIGSYENIYFCLISLEIEEREYTNENNSLAVIN